MPTFWDVQTETIVSLTKLGFKYKQSDRLPIFKIWLDLEKRPQDQLVLEAKNNLEKLLKLRKWNIEPKHSKGRYA